MTKEQSWETCKYAIASDGGDEMTYELRSHGFNEGYNCIREEIIKLDIYPLQNIQERDGSWTEVAILKHIAIGNELSGESVKKLETRVERALAACRHCKLHEEK